MKATFKINPKFARALSRDLEKAMSVTMEGVKDDLVTSQTMPMRDGIMQNDDTYTDVSIDDKLIKGALTTESVYARYQYYGISPVSKKPFDYYTGKNPSARSRWLEPYLHNKVLKERFVESLKEVRGE